MKILESSKNVKFLESEIDKLPILIQKRFDLLHLCNDKVYLIQVLVNKNTWVTKKIILRNRYENILYKIFKSESESDEGFYDRAINEYYKYQDKCNNKKYF